MAHRVREIMNRELFKLGDRERVGDALQYLTALGIGGAPVVDAHDALIGFVSWRNLVNADATELVTLRMTVPVATIPADADIAEAAAALCDRDLHHLVCVDPEGRAVGFVGSLDVLRGVTGRPVPHPQSFPHWDERTGLRWSNDARLDRKAVQGSTPAAAGLFVLVAPRQGEPDRIVWCEAVANIQAYLASWLDQPRCAPPHLADLIARGELWFRFAAAPSARALHEAVTAARSGGVVRRT